MELGGWLSKDNERIEKWNETVDYELQKGRAAQLISYLILRILGRCCNSSGKIRVKRLGTALAGFEQILISARGLEKKFYRDHLNHIIRVALLAMAIGRKTPFNLSRRELDRLVLACLFHDVGYPLSRIGQSFRSTVHAMKNCYNIASGVSGTSNIKLRLRKKLLASVLSIEEKTIEQQLRELDHGLLGALEFMSYLKSDCINNYTDVIKAIAFHSPSFSSEVNEKLLTILMIADEVQDWGRPVNLNVIPKVQSFKLENNLLEGEYNTEGMSSYSVLRQILSKSRNLSRIKLPTNFRFRLRFPLSNLRNVDLRAFEISLQLLYTNCINLEESLFAPSSFKKLYESNSPFESIYYGLPVPKETKMRIFDLLSNEAISSNSPFRNYHVFINRTLNELLFTSSEVDEISSFEFRSFTDDSIRLEMTCNKNHYIGKIKSIRDQEVHKLVLLLLAELRFCNICIQKITRFPSEPYPVTMGIEGFPDGNELRKLLNNTEGLKSLESFECLRSIRDCVFNDGFFLFENSE